MNNAGYFTFLFVLFLIASVGVKTWLNIRQLRYVSSHAGVVPAEFASKISLQEHQKAARYTLENLRFSQICLFLQVIVLLAFTLLGGVNALYGLFDPYRGGFSFWNSLELIFLVLVIQTVVNLPFAYYQTFKLEQKYGFNRSTVALFIKDTLMSFVLALVIFGVLASIIMVLMDTTSLWWFWSWLVFLVFIVGMMYIGPTWIMPLFNKFTPLADGEVKDRINALAKRCDFALNGLFVMDGSKRSSHGNAFFTGFGKNRRIVFFDTLLEKLTPAQIEAVMAHELGHFKHKHISKRLGVIVVLSFIFFFVFSLVADQYWFYQGLGLSRENTFATVFLHHPARHVLALIFVSLVFGTFTFWYTPFSSWSSRRDEFQADAFAAQHSDANELISALVCLYQDNATTLTPDPVYSAYYHSHPPASIRIAHLKAMVA